MRRAMAAVVAALMSSHFSLEGASGVVGSRSGERRQGGVSVT
jgi:hypothetical protein